MSIIPPLLFIFLMFAVSQNEGRRIDDVIVGGLPATGDKLKRRFFDSTCKGIYDRELFAQLERVCEDCYNLYRKPEVATECRRDCYNSEVFESCLHDLMMHDFINEFKDMVHIVAGKK